MANVLILDDEPITLRRLFNVLSKDRQHKLWTSASLVEGVKVVEQLRGNLDLLVIDVSMFQTAAAELLDLFSTACPAARVLAVSPTSKQTVDKRFAVLRKPFADADFIEAIKAVLMMEQQPALPRELKRKVQHQSSCVDRRPIRIGVSAH